jgi:hypothetical protein
MKDNITDNEIVEFIKQIILIYLNAPADYYEKKTRKHEILKVKQYACYFSKRHTALSHKVIAEHFNLKNHSSVISLVKKIDGYALWDKQTKRELAEIETIIKLRGLSKNARIDFEKEYYINMNNFKSVRETPERAIVFIGYDDKEIIELLQTNTEIRKHSNTAKFILEQTLKDVEK